MTLLYLALNVVYALALSAADVRAIVDDPSNQQGLDAVAPIAQIAADAVVWRQVVDAAAPSPSA